MDYPHWTSLELKDFKFEIFPSSRKEKIYWDHGNIVSSWDTLEIGQRSLTIYSKKKQSSWNKDRGYRLEKLRKLKDS